MSSSLCVFLLCDRAPDPGALGGTQLHAAALIKGSVGKVELFAAYPAPHKLVVLRPGSTADAIAELAIGEAPSDPLSPWPQFARALELALSAVGADVLLLQAPQLAPGALCEAIDRSSARVAVTLHDHALVCENHQLLEAGGRYCDLPAERARCDRCLSLSRGRAQGYLERWRSQQRELLERCDLVVAPSESVLATVARIHPSISARARRVEWGVPQPRDRCDPAAAHETPLRIAVAGVLAREKGADQLPDLIGACRGLDVEWHLFGASEGRSLRAIRGAGPRIVVHGAYTRARLAERLIRARSAIGLLPSVVPESFSLTLSELWACGIPVRVGDLGAQRERVLGEDLGWVIDPWRPNTLSETLRTLLADRSAIERRMQRLARRRHRDEASMVEDHVRLWQELAGLGPRQRPHAGSDAEAKRLFLASAPRPANELARALGRRLDDLRKSEWYRDLPLRRLLSESTRARAERVLLRAMRKKTDDL